MGKQEKEVACRAISGQQYFKQKQTLNQPLALIQQAQAAIEKMCKLVLALCINALC
ncbi:hypothetical protein ACLS0R_16045 [Comamonas jiangduensis]|uniref:hypothetical protein n=1 Tax=Comamonas jiangduensis TaxID=1194168 RepID=UPI003BF82B0C